MVSPLLLALISGNNTSSSKSNYLDSIYPRADCFGAFFSQVLNNSQLGKNLSYYALTEFKFFDLKV